MVGLTRSLALLALALQISASLYSSAAVAQDSNNTRFEELAAALEAAAQALDDYARTHPDAALTQPAIDALVNDFEGAELYADAEATQRTRLRLEVYAPVRIVASTKAAWAVQIYGVNGGPFYVRKTDVATTTSYLQREVQLALTELRNLAVAMKDTSGLAPSGVSFSIGPDISVHFELTDGPHRIAPAE